MDFKGKKIALKRTWTLELEIGEGGAGTIYAARDEQGTRAAVKIIIKIPQNSRELSFETLPSHPNILPIWDTGEWEGNYVLVMPLAEKSLRQHMDEVNGALPLEEKIAILIDVAEALASLERDVVHRDLKPANILWYESRWCLADFGIARYLQATTATATQKALFTNPYAAPEQWRHEHATSATDVYAFGVTAFELFEDRLPFSGPDWRDQHLHQNLPALTKVGSSLGALITECLTKAAPARPTPANILLRLQKSQQPSSPAAAALQAINQQIVMQRVQVGTIASAQKSVEDQRREIFNAARQSFRLIMDKLVEQIQNAASAATIFHQLNTTIQFGEAKLLIGRIQPAPPNCLAIFDYPAPFDVIAFTTIKVLQPLNRYQYEGRSHSLWFCDAYEEGVYRWFETAFMISPLIARMNTINPFALAPTDEDARVSFAPMLAERQIAWEPVPFDQGDEEQFLERWIHWLTGAATGSLQNPRSMPEQSGGRHRHPT